MALKDYAELLPEDKREAYKAEIDKAVFIESKEDAERIAATNQYMKAVSQSIIDKRFQDREEKFKKDELPKLLEEERKKGQKQPWEIEIEKLKKENEDAKRETALEKQRTRAMAKLSELKMPAKLADKYTGLTDEETDSLLKELVDTIMPWKDKAVTEIKERYGTQKDPIGGDGADKGTMSRREFEALPADKKTEVARTTKIVDNPAV